jgi:hypothetical protein
MQAAKEGNVDRFLQETEEMASLKDMRILLRARKIFLSQMEYLFGADDKKELQAALREATILESKDDYDDAYLVIAKEAATPKVLELAQRIRELHSDSDDSEEKVQDFLRMAYDMKCMFRKTEKEED